MLLNAPSWLVKLIDATRAEHDIVWTGLLPTGERVALSRQILDHIQIDRSRSIDKQSIIECVETPDSIALEMRPKFARKQRRVMAICSIRMPSSGKKAKFRVVHMKKCIEMVIFCIYYVNTAIETSKIQPDAKEIWRKGVGKI